MDKRNQMENPFFDPDKPGSIFVGMDRYHQYSPHQPRNALTFIQKGDADSLFRKFLIDNIKEAECCPYRKRHRQSFQIPSAYCCQPVPSFPAP